MKRRVFSLAASTAAMVAFGLLPGHAQAQAQGKKPDEGIEYITLDKPVPVEAPAGKVEVVEFFWYSCPHCNAFEPQLEGWIKAAPADVFVTRVPVAFRDSFVPQQRLFYTLEAMGKLGDLHRKVFNAIHIDKLLLNREDLILDWVGKQGLDKGMFQELYNASATSAKCRRATQLVDAFKVQGVPSMGIAGRYYTDGALAGTMNGSLAVADYLIAQVRAGS